MTSDSFSVDWRNHGQWDISIGGERVFRIRGEPGDVRVSDERIGAIHYNNGWIRFKTVIAAMTWIADDLMSEQ